MLVKNLLLRLEREDDYRQVEKLTREAFWNLHGPGCEEHFLIHNLRKSEHFVRDLDFVATLNNKIIGHIAYVETKIKDVDKEYDVLTFGPLSVLPEYQGNGVGEKLIEHTKSLAKERGYKAIVIYGDPNYYQKFGFKQSKLFGITNNDGKYPAALLVLELYQDALRGVRGIFDEGSAYQTDPSQLELFDENFGDNQEKLTTDSASQLRFRELVSLFL